MSSDCLDDYHAAPPSPLLALVGMPHLHGALQAAAAAAEPKPRVLSFASDGAYVEAQPVPSGEAANLVLKPGWLHKHTHCIAGAAALLASWDDSTSATGVAAQIGAIRNASGRSRLLLVLVQASGEASPAPPSEERIAALRRACDLEPRSLLVVSADGPPPSLDAASLARGVKVLLEAAAAYYRDEARAHALQRRLPAPGSSAPHPSRNLSKARRARPPKATAPQLAARHHTKRAVFAELSHEPALTPRAAPHARRRPFSEPSQSRPAGARPAALAARGGAAARVCCILDAERCGGRTITRERTPSAVLGCLPHPLHSQPSGLHALLRGHGAALSPSARCAAPPGWCASLRAAGPRRTSPPPSRCTRSSGWPSWRSAASARTG